MYLATVVKRLPISQVTDLIASTDFCANLGTIFVEVHKLIDAEPDLASLSLSELRSKLDDEGLPIDALIDELSDLSQANQSILDTLILHIKSRLHEPDALHVLADCIESQGKQVSISIHQLLDKSVQNALVTAEVGGGFGKKIVNHPWASVGVYLGATAIAGGITAGVAKRVQTARYNEAMSQAKSDTSEFIAKQEEAAESALRYTSRRELIKAEDRPAETIKEISFDADKFKHDTFKVTLAKDVDQYTETEIRELFSPWTTIAKERFNEALELQVPKVQERIKLQLRKDIARANLQKDIDYDLRSGLPPAAFDKTYSTKKLFLEEFERTDNPDIFDAGLDDYFLAPYKKAFKATLKGESQALFNGEIGRLDQDIQRRIAAAVKVEKDRVKETVYKTQNQLEKIAANDADREAERLGAALGDTLNAVKDTAKGAEDTFEDIL